MFSFFFESPITLVFVGMAFTIMAAFGWLKTGHRIAALSAIGLFITTIVLFAVERTVLTYREEMQNHLTEIARNLQANQYDAVIASIHPAAINALAQAKSELPNYKFSEARVTSIRGIEIDTERKTPRAVARFNVFVALDYQGQKVRIPRFVEATFYRENGKWLMYDYRHAEPTEGLIRRPQ